MIIKLEFKSLLSAHIRVGLFEVPQYNNSATDKITENHR